jgi:Zn-dependent M28 family amino/carboxypeptidase
MSATAGLMELAARLDSTGLIPKYQIRILSLAARRGRGSIFLTTGATHYNDRLSEDDEAAESLYLDIYSIGSPNNGRFAFANNLELDNIFSDAFGSFDLTWEGADAFDESRVPFALITSGSSGNKTEDQVCLFGGTAGERYAT